MGFGALVVAGPAGATPIVLPSPAVLVEPPPPLIGGTTPLETENELRFPGHVRNSERVEVSVRDDGSASKVVVTQRLVISQIGDYSFTIPAPVLTVVPASGSQSQPGQRNTGVVWQGFSSGHRLLAARASLEPPAAERGLPISIKITRRGDATVVRLITIARRRVSITRGFAPAGRLRALLRVFRISVQASDRVALTRTLQVEGVSRGAGSIVVDAPLRLRGSISIPGWRVPVAWTLGAGEPLTREVELPGRTVPRLDLKVDLFRPLELLPRDEELGGSGGLERLELALARVALSAQYDQYLASPDQFGLNRTTYVFRTAAEKSERVPPQLRPGAGGTSDVLAIVLASVLGAAALVGLVVAWAHS